MIGHLFAPNETPNPNSQNISVLEKVIQANTPNELMETKFALLKQQELTEKQLEEVNRALDVEEDRYRRSQKIILGPSEIDLTSAQTRRTPVRYMENPRVLQNIYELNV